MSFCRSSSPAGGGDDGGGGSADTAPAGGTPQEQVTATVDRYFEALADGDGEAFCAELTPDATKIAAGLGDAGSCEAAAAKVAGQAPDDQLDALRNVEVTGTTVDGDQAVARIAVGGERAAEPMRLQRHEGEWKVSSFATGGAEAQAKADEATCVESGLEAFDRGEGDAFWHEVGRAKFSSYLSAFCREAVKRRATGDEDATAIIREEVIEEMVQRGRIPDPAG